ncbi:glycosyltransferase [Bacteroidales bacterium OttesenSCG-928-M06]|nr:glycosyltransferase [Bacteroidales bacterium OttesenSCG-928-M06]
MMKVFQVNVVYKFGSTGKIVSDIHSTLINKGYESIVCYGRGDQYQEQNVYKLAPEIVMKFQSLQSKISGFQYKGGIIGTQSLINKIENNKPDVVHLHCINAYMVNIYKILDYLKKHNIPTVLTFHAEFMYTGGCIHAHDCDKWKTGCYDCSQNRNKISLLFFSDIEKKQWNLLKESYSGFDNMVITCVSNWMAERVRLSPFFKSNRIEVIFNGLDTNIFRPTPFDDLIVKHELVNYKIVLHITPNFMDPLKGGRFVIELAHNFYQSHPEIKFIVIGSNVCNANIDIPPNIIPLPFTVDMIELAKYYSLANLTLLTSSKETFSMVTAESLSCGTPVIGFKSGGPESMALPEYSSFVEYGNVAELEKKILEMIDLKFSHSNIAEEAHKIYSKEQMANKFIDVYNALLK